MKVYSGDDKERCEAIANFLRLTFEGEFSLAPSPNIPGYWDITGTDLDAKQNVILLAQAFALGWNAGFTAGKEDEAHALRFRE